MNANRREVNPTVIVAGARTPIGRLLGGLRSLTAAELGGIAIKGALEKSGVKPEQVDYLITGQVLQAGTGQNPARTAGPEAGIPADVPSITINKVCLSGLNAIATTDQMIRAGEAEIVVAGGMELMTNARGCWRGVERASSTATCRSSTTWPTTGSMTRQQRRRWARSPRPSTPNGT